MFQGPACFNATFQRSEYRIGKGPPSVLHRHRSIGYPFALDYVGR